TPQEAAARLVQFGPNEPAATQHHSLLSDLLHVFANPLVLILVIAAIISAFMGQATDAVIIGVIVLLSAVIDVTQTYRSQQAMERLRDRVAPTATVLRGGEWKEIQRRDVVPGDVIRLSAGDLVPADARLLVARDLYVQQAALTGESLPTEKAATGEPASAKAEARNMVFLGTSVVSGTATAEVVATGPHTAFGDIAARLAARPEETAFDRGLRNFSQLLAKTVLFLVIFLIVASILRHRDVFQSLLFAVALAVGLTPEFLPMITSVTLSKGAVAMARKKVIVKHLSAIQNLGSLDVFCSDKTGTLTAGTMSLDRSLDPFGTPSQRALELAYLNSKFETGIRSPLDDVILHQPSPPNMEGYTKRDEIPFDFERRRLSVVVERQSQRILITKGAPEGILPLLSGYEQEGKTELLSADAVKRIQQIGLELNDQGFRSLAVAYADVPARADYSVADERNLILAGFLTFSDEPLADAAQAMASLKQDGVEVKVISGDNDRVTAHVCSEVGIASGHILTGDELDRMTDPALGHDVEETQIFARISPAQKNRILSALKHNGHAVGFMGDGINDAPSIHAADVGISVPSAVDVAREAADVILVQPGLGVLNDGIIEGRKAFGNVMKYLLMETSSNFGNVLSMAAASFFLPFLPMLPTQILLNNLLYDTGQLTIPTDNVDETYLQKPQHWNINLIRDFMVLIGPISSLFDFLTFYVLLHFFHSSEAQFHTGWFVESLATQTLVLFVIRTSKNPLLSRPSKPLSATCLAVVAIGVYLPFSPLAGVLGFTPLPASYFAFLAVATAAYLLLVEVAKRRLLSRTTQTNAIKVK
ncbi:MAG TPA: magnesium-translocating P-type ATPase, partial [Candidatus Sulfotelmatobacter sp.]|nr:magnesium-translocating P-type ATPase [Candidatus Sulfotelmatobacter sp.]